ncbi:hypothetical protein R9X47_28420 [Wukongibacter baidiensis]|uniref:hypothetical protein n=1 Tax=Wukongibacter baidiensis TaxID=1723361 RepID=UPI003D7F1CB4
MKKSSLREDIAELSRVIGYFYRIDISYIYIKDIESRENHSSEFFTYKLYKSGNKDIKNMLI